MKRWSRRLGLVAAIVATAAFAWYATTALRGQDLSVFATPRAVAAILVAAAFYVSIIPVSAWAWRQLLADAGTLRAWHELAMIMGVTQLAKYLPGNVGQHVGRVGMALARGIHGRVLVTSLLAETLLSVVAALAVGLVGAVLSGHGTRLFDGDLGPGLVVAACAVAVVAAGLLALRWNLPWLLRRFAPRHAGVLEARLVPGPATTLRATAAYALNFVFIGIGLWLMGRLLLPGVAHDPALLVASFALAWVAGFFTPGAPAGLGVREGLMLVMLATAYAPRDALVVVIALRLATLLGDLACFCGSMLLLHASRRSADPPLPAGDA